jgi:hypothetical protein
MRLIKNKTGKDIRFEATRRQGIHARHVSGLPIFFDAG